MSDRDSIPRGAIRGANGNGFRRTSFRFRKAPVSRPSFKTMGPSDGNNGRWRRSPADFDHPLWHVGWSDGRRGQPLKDSQEVLDLEEQLLEIEERRRLAGEIGKRRQEEARLTARADHADKRCSAVEGAAAELSEERRKQPGLYSWVLGLLYLVAAALLFLADIPLSLRLVADNFGLPVEKTVDNVELGVEDLVAEPSQVMEHLWEAVLLALGIMLFGFLVKWAIDELSRIVSDRGRRQLLWWSVAVVLGLLGATLICLSVVRDQQQAVQDKATRDAPQGSSYTEPVPGNEPDGGGSPGPPPATQGEEPSAGVDFTLWSFLLLTLLLPVAGGIFFTTGWRRLENWFNYRRTTLRELWYRRRRDRAKEKLEETRARREALEGRLDDLPKESRIRKAFGREMHHHGFLRGSTIPETLDWGAGTYERCERLLFNALAGSEGS